MVVWWNEGGIVKSGMVDDNADITKPVKVRPFFEKDIIVSKVYRSKAEARQENIEEWTRKIDEGMKLIVEGCKENDTWGNCYDCPFERICEILTNNSQPTNNLQPTGSVSDGWLEGYLPMVWEIT